VKINNYKMNYTMCCFAVSNEDIEKCIYKNMKYYEIHFKYLKIMVGYDIVVIWKK